MQVEFGSRDQTIFKAGDNQFLVSDINSGGGPSGAAFFSMVRARGATDPSGETGRERVPLSQLPKREGARGLSRASYLRARALKCTAPSLARSVRRREGAKQGTVAQVQGSKAQASEAKQSQAAR